MKNLVKKMAELKKAQHTAECFFYDMRDAYLVPLVDGKKPKRLAKFAGFDFECIIGLMEYLDNLKITMSALRAEMAVKLAAAGKTEMTGDGWTVKLTDIKKDPGYNDMADYDKLFELQDYDGRAELKDFLLKLKTQSFDDGIQSVVVTINGENI